MICLAIPPPNSYVSVEANSGSTVVIATEISSLQTKLEDAAFYLQSMYNSKLGLVANSEDEGPNPMEDPVPCNRTYWVYSDNLWAGYALQPFYPEIADNITDTVQQYITGYGRSMLFEAAIGEQIPTTIHDGANIKVFDGNVSGIRVQVLLDRHQPQDNPGIFHDAEDYADLCFYMTINYWMMNDTNTSLDWFRMGERLWNYTTNKGFYDNATRQEGLYQNYKLGLFLLAQRVTEFDSNITEDVEATAWSYKNDLGGITTLSWLNGSPYGTANAEATTALLPAYNEELISRLQDRTSPNISITSPEDGSELKSPDVSVTWSGVDDFSGINHYEIKLDEETWIEVGTDTSYLFTGVPDGSHTVSIKAIDMAGNSKVEQVSFTVNTSLIGGPGWVDDIAVFGGMGIIVIIGLVLLSRRKMSMEEWWSG